MIIRTWIVLVVFIVVTQVALATETGLPFGIRAYSATPAPRFQLQNMDGESIDLQTLRDNWVFVHFWASWCGPCRLEMPAIEKLSQIITYDKLPIVMVNVAEDEDTVFSFLAEVTPTLDSFMDTDGQAIEAWKPRGLPATYLVDPAGNIRYQALGGREWHQLEYTDFIKRVMRKKHE
ncbi:MAG: TlpA disulfide reductase family protein [Gammaproteobacteria bacterium]